MSRQTQATTAAGTGAEPQETGGGRVSRPRRRRAAISKWAQPVYPIKAIWESASEEERTKARALATEILGYWVGIERKEDLAKRLGVPPIRVWQISQRAVAGMVAAMLRPPSGRRGRMPKRDPEVTALRERIAELERENEVQRRLIQVLRTMPGNERRGLPEEEPDVRSRRKGRRKVEPRGPQAGPGTPPSTGT